jgi:hypothetical protein
MVRRFTVGSLTKIVKIFKEKELFVLPRSLSITRKIHVEIVNVSHDKNKRATGQNYVQNSVSYFCHIGQ